MSEKILVAVPSVTPGGLDADRSAHFGHADGFTVVTVEDGTAVAQQFLGNEAHAAGGCLSPVALLAGAGVQAVVVGGIGGRPLAGLLDAGIAVHQDGASATVGEAIAAFVNGETMVFDPGTSCGCGGHGHEHSH